MHWGDVGKVNFCCENIANKKPSANLSWRQANIDALLQKMSMIRKFLGIREVFDRRPYSFILLSKSSRMFIRP